MQQMKTQLEPHIFIVFGGTGDLMGRKLLPALYRLRRQNLISKQVQILGVARDREMTTEAYRVWAADQLAASGIPLDDWAKSWCGNSLHFQSIAAGSAEDYRLLKDRILDLESDNKSPENRLFYLALPPGALEKTATGLGESGYTDGAGWTRLVIEKPFGRDLISATQLNNHLHQYFDETQLYRIDHYLGKETVQNLLVFRFANPIFESLWNRDRVESVRIAVAEELGVGSRAGYYDSSGAVRDMVQNHLTQLMCLTAMEVPATLDADSIRDEKVKVLRSVAPITSEKVTFGQYSPSGSGEDWLPGYLDEPGIASDSKTETFAALRLEVENWRWQGVPFILRTGKRLDRRLTQVTVRFRCPPVQLFGTKRACRISSNELSITLQPEEGFDLNFEVKSPGQEVLMQTESLHFRYAEVFGSLPEAYETLLLDVAEGDQTLFVRGDEVEAAWRLYEPVLRKEQKIHPYPAGTSGPKAAESLYQR
jgi:glucose-6-phosphate 1-dehydrogenase